MHKRLHGKVHRFFHRDGGSDVSDEARAASSGPSESGQTSTDATPHQTSPETAEVDENIQTATNATSHQTNTDSAPGSIREVKPSNPARPKILFLWDEAYGELKVLEAALVADYEGLLNQALAESTAPNGTASQSQQMASLIELQLKTLEENKWKLKFQGHELKLKDIVEPVVGIVTWAKDAIDLVVKSSVPASAAWMGVCLLLPLLLNPSSQTAGRVNALEVLAETINRCHLREDLYQRRYDDLSDDDSKTSETYYMSLKSLCVKILTFQATCVVALSRNTLKGLTLDVFKWEDWDNLIGAVNKQEVHLEQMERLLNDLEFDKQVNDSRLHHDAMLKETSSIHQELKQIAEMIEQTKGSDTLRWLATSVDPFTNYNAARSKHDRDSGSGEWLVKSDKFNHWIREPDSFLWVHGKPGGGKTILSSTVIHHLEGEVKTTLNAALAFYFFSFQDKATQSTETLLRSLLANVCRQRPSIPPNIAQWKRIGKSPSPEELESELKASTADFSSVFIVVDALDECPESERSAVLGVIERLKTDGPANLHFLLTSRPEADIRFSLEPMLDQPANNGWQVDLQAHRDKVDEDIGMVIDEAFKSYPFVRWSSGSRSASRETLVEKADGMFQYVALQIDTLRKGGSNESNRQQILNDMPVGLEGLYDRILLQIPLRDRAIAHRALQWLAFHDGDVTVGELAELAIIDSTVLHAESNIRLLEDLRLDPPDRLLSMLQGLVVTSEDVDGHWQDETDRHHEFQNDHRKVLLSHFTVKEYLAHQTLEHKSTIRTEFAINEVHSRILIVESVLWYFVYLSEVLHRTIPPELTQDQDNIHGIWKAVGPRGMKVADSLPLDHWTACMKALISTIMAPEKRVFDTFWVQMLDQRQYIPNMPEDIWRDTRSTSSFPFFQYLTRCYTTLTIFLLNENSDIHLVNQILPPDGTALAGAAYWGKFEVLKTLLKVGADPYIFFDPLEASEFTCAVGAAIDGDEYDCFVALLGSRDQLRRYSEEGDYWPLESVAGAYLLGWDAKKRMFEHIFSLEPEIKSLEPWPGAALVLASARNDPEAIQFLIAKGSDIEGKRPCDHLHVSPYESDQIRATALQTAVIGTLPPPTKSIRQLILLGAVVDPLSEDWNTLRDQLDALSQDKRSRFVRCFQKAFGKQYKTSFPTESTIDADIQRFEMLRRESLSWNGNAAPWDTSETESEEDVQTGDPH